ncbi:lysozyme inhibitor LprI family protein [Aquibaculum arenosum]|uniref:DUF1311 domain-containing protein n=1 Tax=Aquibaculum arenosum TaxID=3032591 RepID=A0ABT5YRL5_9PROT|nr:lysozyme inhibitor LprI family protein [Fodinicurvata sp. CAU 1616]MDF2097529.1 DUF1311 domain-containing protein [Fodinicurvata sp. CAU 1616]
MTALGTSYAEKIGLSLLTVLGLAWALAIPVQAAAGDRDISHDIRECREDPRFRDTGGAMIGDCLLEISNQVDAEIERIVARSAKAYCRQEDRALLARTQSDWQTYRQGWCQLVEHSPGNTPAYVNSAACMLETGRDRLTSLAYIVDYGEANCPFNRLLLEDSRFGDPTGAKVKMASLPVTWEARAQDGALTLALRRNAHNDIGLIGEVNLAGCIFCPDGETGCDDGVFFMESRDTVTSHSLFYVCHLANGARRFELFHLSGSIALQQQRQMTEANGFEWSLELHDLAVTPRGALRSMREGTDD